MTVLRTIAAELIALFVDDGWFAIAVVACVAVVGLADPTLALPPRWRDILLFLGLAVILIESVARRARST